MFLEGEQVIEHPTILSLFMVSASTGALLNKLPMFATGKRG